jgi:hypothetical protein
MLHQRLLSWLLLPLALMLSGGSHGDEPARSSNEPPDRAQIECLIRQLGSRAFHERQAASRQLEKIGPPALEALRAAATGSTDAEVRNRAAHVTAVIENSLDQLLIDYRSLGLPLPSKDAQLVGYGEGANVLAFLLKPKNRTEPWIFLRGTFEEEPEWEPPNFREVKPEPDAVKHLCLSGQGLAFAIQCHARGWGKLAKYLLEQDRKEYKLPPRQRLLETAWCYWVNQLTRPKVDRAPIAKRLKELIGKAKTFDTEPNRALLRSLELSLVPSRAKPGSVAALIDSLVDYTNYTEALDPIESEDPYWRLAELGFDAVPALMEHLNDDRLTRGMTGGLNNFFPRHMRVADVVSDLLERLAGQDIGRGWMRRLQGYAVEGAEAKKWWDEARRVGEERYLLDHVLPGETREGTVGVPNYNQLRVIVAKYPGHIPTLYRTALDRSPAVDSWALARAVSRSNLPVKEKIDLFRYAAKRKNNRHRLLALLAIKELDQKQFDALFLATIEALPDGLTGPEWIWRPEGDIVQLAFESDQPQVWPALEKVTKRAPDKLRMELLNQIADPKDHRHRTERLRLMVGLLEDDALRDIRNIVALELASLLGIEAPVNPERTQIEWTQLSRKARESMDHALRKQKETSY